MNFTQLTIIDVDENEDFKNVDYLHDTNITIIHNLYHQGDKGELDINDPEVPKYIDISFGMLNANWNNETKAEEDVFTYTKFGVKTCE